MNRWKSVSSRCMGLGSKPSNRFQRIAIISGITNIRRPRRTSLPLECHCNATNRTRCCVLLQYLIQSCAHGGRRIVEDMCYEIRRAEACVDSFRFKRAAFYQSLKSKVELAAAKAAALRINLSVEGCGILAGPVHAPFRAPLFLPLLLSHNLFLPRVH